MPNTTEIHAEYCIYSLHSYCPPQPINVFDFEFALAYAVLVIGTPISKKMKILTLLIVSYLMIIIRITQIEVSRKLKCILDCIDEIGQCHRELVNPVNDSMFRAVLENDTILNGLSILQFSILLTLVMLMRRHNLLYITTVIMIGLKMNVVYFIYHMFIELTSWRYSIYR